MAKLRLARELAEQTGKSLSEARRFVEDVGVPRAQSLVDEAAEAGSRTVQNWWKPTLAGGTLIGGGALAWRQQDLQQARAIAAQQQDYGSAIESIMDSDLPPDKKQEMVDSLINNSPASQQNQGGDGGDGGGGLLGGDAQTTIILLVVLAFVMRYTLGSDN